MKDASAYIRMIDEARQLAASRQYERARELFETVLRRVTPDDTEIELAMGFQQRGVSEYPASDAVDSSLRTELVYVLSALGRLDEAIHHARIALYLDRALYGEVHPNVSQCHHDIGLLQANRYDIGSADEHFELSEEIDKVLSPEFLVTVHRRRTERLQFYHSYSFLKKAAQHAMSLVDSNLPDTGHEQVMTALNFAAQCLQDIGEHALAREYTERAISQQLSSGDLVPDFLYENLGYLLHEQGNFFESEQYFLRSARYRSEGRVRDSLKRERDLLAQWSVDSRDHDQDVFLSFSADDEMWAVRLGAALDRLGATVWTFKKAKNWQDLTDDEQIKREMRIRIEHSRILVVVVSDASLGSEFVYDEVVAARSVPIPVIGWYSGGARVRPKAASTRPDLSDDRRDAFTVTLSGGGVYSYFGFGLRDQDIRVIALAILKKFTQIYPAHRLATSPANRDLIDDALDGTRTWPVYVEVSGRPVDLPARR